jgi:hypothetical protein
VAEYFRGICFKTFFEKSWSHDEAVRELAQTDDDEVRNRVRKKLDEYLNNLVENLPQQSELENLQPFLKSKTKNLPQRYHVILEQVVRAFLEGKWGDPDHG